MLSLVTVAVGLHSLHLAMRATRKQSNQTICILRNDIVRQTIKHFAYIYIYLFHDVTNFIYFFGCILLRKLNAEAKISDSNQ